MRPRFHAELCAQARRHLRDASAAEDVVQEALLAAVTAGRADLEDPVNRRWLAGVVRNQARQQIRTNVRRRRREEDHAAIGAAPVARDSPGPAEVLTGLPPALRAVAALILTGHNRREIAWLLRLPDTALRQRIAALKRVLVQHGVAAPTDFSGLNLDIAYGRIRQALLPKLLREGGHFASHDPDGHLFVIRRSQNPIERQQGVQTRKGSAS